MIIVNKAAYNDPNANDSISLLKKMSFGEVRRLNDKESVPLLVVCKTLLK